jgi:hypothetical protein
MVASIVVNTKITLLYVTFNGSDKYIKNRFMTKREDLWGQM